MQPHQERVVKERDDLIVKLEALRSFMMNSPLFLTIPRAEQARLVRQSDAMADYADILLERIEAFQDTKETP